MICLTHFPAFTVLNLVRLLQPTSHPAAGTRLLPPFLGAPLWLTSAFHLLPAEPRATHLGRGGADEPKPQS